MKVEDNLKFVNPIVKEGTEMQDMKEMTSNSPVKIQAPAVKPVQVREQWANKMEFIMACTAFSIGLGNVSTKHAPYILCIRISGIQWRTRVCDWMFLQFLFLPLFFFFFSSQGLLLRAVWHFLSCCLLVMPGEEEEEGRTYAVPFDRTCKCNMSERIRCPTFPHYIPLFGITYFTLCQAIEHR